MIFEAARHPVIVVAHPDDEVMWCGGLLARYGEKFTVICCSIPKADPERALKFTAACNSLGALPRLLPFAEEAADIPLKHLDNLDLDPFDLIVTHNSVGEYGHLHHRQINAFVCERWGSKTATFGWRPAGRGNKVLYLTTDERAQRMVALQCYDHVSPHDGGKPKWQALLDRYAIDLRTETFNASCS